MSIDLDLVLKNQLVERRRRVSSAISAAGPDHQLTSLMQQIDAVLERFEAGTYGLCDVCHDSVEAERLIANPLERFCIDHLSQDEQRALEDDLTLAAQIQRGLLPTHPMRVGDWKLDYCYEPARIVSGDYVDILQNGDLYFVIGDVSGKGVAASMLMAKLHTVFRSLIPLQLSVDKLMERASRLFGDSILWTICHSNLRAINEGWCHFPLQCGTSTGIAEPQWKGRTDFRDGTSVGYVCEPEILN